jgi:hypothetical protein
LHKGDEGEGEVGNAMRPLTVCGDNQHEDIAFIGGDCPLCGRMEALKAVEEEYESVCGKLKQMTKERDALQDKLSAYEYDIRESVRLARTADVEKTTP